MPTYTRASLTTEIARDASAVQNINTLINRAVRYVVSDIDLRSTKRRSYLAPVLHEQVYDYQAPSDLKELALIDIRKLKDRIAEFRLVPGEEFDRNKSNAGNLVCIEDRDWFKKLRISAEISGSQSVLHEMDSITGDGTWVAALDASNLTLDQDNFLQGEGSLNFDMDQAGTTTTAGYLTITNMAAVDLSDYLNASIFVYVYAPTITNLNGITLRVGSSASNYFSKQATVTNENLSLHTGWLLLRFDIAGMTQTGTVDMSSITYLRVAIDKANAGITSTDWRVDYIVARRGSPHEVIYYTKYGWQTSAGAYIENSTVSTDLLNADTEEFELIILKGKEIVAKDLKMFDDAKEYHNDYEDRKQKYLNNYPSERLVLTSDYYSFESLSPTRDIDDDDND